MTRHAFVPIPRGQKRPNKKGWNLKENCIFGSISDLLDENIGLAHAYCVPVHCALDIDNFSLAEASLKEINLDIRKILKSPKAAVLHSGRKQSLKAIFSLPDTIGPLVTKTVKSQDKVIYELRCASSRGLTVCDVIPPSLHPQGTQYRWIQSDLDSVTQIPDALLVHWLKLLERTSTAVEPPKKQSFSPNSGFETPRKLALLSEQLRFIDSDCDYETWRNVIWAILSTDFPSAHSIAREWSERSPHRYNYNHFISTVHSWRPEKAAHTLGTIYHLARIGGWRDD